MTEYIKIINILQDHHALKNACQAIYSRDLVPPDYRLILEQNSNIIKR